MHALRPYTTYAEFTDAISHVVAYVRQAPGETLKCFLHCCNTGIDFGISFMPDAEHEMKACPEVKAKVSAMSDEDKCKLLDEVVSQSNQNQVGYAASIDWQMVIAILLDLLSRFWK